MPLLSFIIPLFNTEDFISECLSSILDNDVDKSLYEVIVVDDGSTDSSAEVVRGYCSRFNTVRLVRQENQGVSAARMRGISFAQGDYIWFVDSDDYLLPYAVPEIINLIDMHRDIDVFVTPMKARFEKGRKAYYSQQEQCRCTISGKVLLRDKSFRIVGPPQFIMKRSLFRNKWLFFPEGLRFEDEYFARVLKYMDGKFLLLEKPLYVYRQWSGSHMNSIQVQNSQDIISIYGFLDKYAREVVADKDIPWFRNNIVSFLFESYTRNSRYFGSIEFDSFQKKNAPFIRSEWKKYHKFFSVKDQVLARILLFSPSLYRYLIHVNDSRRRRNVCPTV